MASNAADKGTYKALSIPKATHVAPSHSTYRAPKPSRSLTSSSSSHRYRTPGARNSNGRLARSTKANDDFKHSHPCPSTGKSSGACPGFVIDHVRPLKRGGADDPSNMQWQTKAAVKAKDNRGGASPAGAGRAHSIQMLTQRGVDGAPRWRMPDSGLGTIPSRSPSWGPT
jgi:hypothetical protein